MPGSRALFYRPPFVSWVGHLSFVLRSLPLRSLRSLRETNGGLWVKDGGRNEDPTEAIRSEETEGTTHGGRNMTTKGLTLMPWVSRSLRFSVLSAREHAIHPRSLPSSGPAPPSERSEWHAKEASGDNVRRTESTKRLELGSFHLYPRRFFSFHSIRSEERGECKRAEWHRSGERTAKWMRDERPFRTPFFPSSVRHSLTSVPSFLRRRWMERDVDDRHPDERRYEERNRVDEGKRW